MREIIAKDLQGQRKTMKEWFRQYQNKKLKEIIDDPRSIRKEEKEIMKKELMNIVKKI